MVTDSQIRRLIKLSNTERTQEIAAAKAGMDPKTARKYLRTGKLPSELRMDRNWRTREDPFNDVWEAIRERLALNPGLEGKDLIGDDCRGINPGASLMGSYERYSAGSRSGD